MSLISLTLLLGASLLAHAAPTDPDIALARKFAPQFKFHQDEKYWPSTVEYFLKGVKVVDDSGNTVAASVNQQTLDDTPGQGAGLYLNTDIDAGKKGFLLGQNPATSSPDVNTFVAHKANGVIDIYYWLFTPFNSAKSVPLLGQVGDHVADWERLVVRTVDGVPTTVDFHAHSDTGSGTIPWAQAPKFDNGNRPVGYVAQGSHGFWSSAGTFTYVDAVIFKLQDITSDTGLAWDTQNHISPLLYPDTYTGDKEWLNYKGAWGNKGEDDCWWHIFYDQCELITGPTGPLRDDVLGSTAAKSLLASPASSPSLKDRFKAHMVGTLSQIIGTASSEPTSSFKIRLDSTVDLAAKAGSFSKVAVQQTCVQKSEEDKEKDVTTTTVATAALPATVVTITPAACTSGHIQSYTIGLCTSDAAESCTWASSARVLRAFHADQSIHGIQDATAIVVDDLDNWEW